MNRIYRYELKRAILSKSFYVMLLICLFFAWNILTTATIQGVEHTAPFSCRSFADYFLRMLPLMLSALVILWLKERRGSAKRMLPITNAMPTPPRLLQKTRMAVVWTAWLSIGLFVTLLGVGFLTALFHEAVPVGGLLLTASAVFLPLPLLWALWSYISYHERAAKQ